MPELHAFFGVTSARLAWWTMIVLFAVTALTGGSSRPESSGLLILRPLVVVCAAIFLLIDRDRDSFVPVITLRFLAILAILMVIQIMPLPPALWSALPGHAQFDRAAAIGYFAPPWRGISLTPDLTWNSLVSLFVPATVLIGISRLRTDQLNVLVVVLLAIVFLSAVLGIFQAASGSLVLYAYDLPQAKAVPGTAVGFFANRNHQAAALAMGFPLLRAWAAFPGDRQWVRGRTATAVALGLFLVPMILFTGSRAGLVLGCIGLVTAWFVGKRPSWSALRRNRRARGALAVLAIMAGVLAFAVIASGRATSLDRALGVHDYADEVRLKNTPLVWHITKDFLPFGSGFGSFDPIFRSYEPDASLTPSYYNHAHNDFLEILLTGGIPAAMLVAAFAAWLVRSGSRVLRAPSDDAVRWSGALGLGIIAIAAIASVVDYPLRTPLMMTICTVASAYVERATRRNFRPNGPDSPPIASRLDMA